MVEVARRIDAASNFTGSGGAVMVFCPEGPSQGLREISGQKSIITSSHNVFIYAYVIDLKSRHHGLG
ncbi:unnamed protein product [Brassica oleracea var. botrytis]